MEKMKKNSIWMQPEMIEEIEKALPFSYDENKRNCQCNSERVNER